MSVINLIDDKQSDINDQSAIEYSDEGDYQGRKMDHQLRNGPVYYRKYQDIKCTVLFLGMWGLMIYFAIDSWKDADISKIYTPYDSQQRQCGKGLLKDFPNIYILDEIEHQCVSSCPDASDVGKELPCYDCQKTVPYPSEELITLCYPTSDADEKYINLIDGITNITYYQRIYSDIRETWYLIFLCIWIAFTISCLALIAIRKATEYIVWGMITVYLIVLMTFGTVAYIQSQGYYEEYRILNDTKSLLIIAYLSWSIGAISFFIILFLIKRIKQAIVVLRVAANFAEEEWQVMFVPIYCLFMAIGFFLYWAIFSAMIYSSGAYFKKDSKSPYFPLEVDPSKNYIVILYWVGYMWSVRYALALCQFVISSCCCMWYYSHQGYPLEGSIKRSFHIGFTTSFGSLLFGSLVMFILYLLKKLLGFYYTIFKKMGKPGRFQWLCVSICGFTAIYAACFEKLFRYLNTNAYIIMALTGQSYFNSGQNAFHLIRRNSMRVVVTKGLGEIFSILGVLFVSVSSSFICYLIITQNDYFINNIINPMIPTLFFFLVSVIVGAMFMNLFGMGVETLLICYIIDGEQNQFDGNSESKKPNFFQKIADQLF